LPLIFAEPLAVFCIFGNTMWKRLQSHGASQGLSSVCGGVDEIITIDDADVKGCLAKGAIFE
jgi:hypothetical protein